MMLGLGETFDYAVCASCQTLFIAVVPASLADYYSSKYYSFDVDPQAVMGRPAVAAGVRRVARGVLFGSNRVSAALVRSIVASPAPRQVKTLVLLLSTV